MKVYFIDKIKTMSLASDYEEAERIFSNIADINNFLAGKLAKENFISFLDKRSLTFYFDKILGQSLDSTPKYDVERETKMLVDDFADECFENMGIKSRNRIANYLQSLLSCHSATHLDEAERKELIGKTLKSFTRLFGESDETYALAACIVHPNAGENMVFRHILFDVLKRKNFSDFPVCRGSEKPMKDFVVWLLQGWNSSAQDDRLVVIGA